MLRLKFIYHHGKKETQHKFLQMSIYFAREETDWLWRCYVKLTNELMDRSPYLYLHKPAQP